MELMNKEISEKLPPLYSQEDVGDPICHLKYFDPCGSFTWYVIEYDGQDMFFGMFNLSEALGI